VVSHSLTTVTHPSNISVPSSGQRSSQPFNCLPVESLSPRGTGPRTLCSGIPQKHLGTFKTRSIERAIQWVLQFFAEGKAVGGVKSTTNQNLVPKLRMRGVIPLLPQKALIAWIETIFPVFFFNLMLCVPLCYMGLQRSQC
jgi:hypothetical protein